MSNIKVVRLLLKCYAEKDHDQWVACCIDLCLAAQADSYKEARIKLENMIKEYVYDALVGQDKEHAYYLLTRKAPIHERFKYYFYNFLAKFVNPETSTHRSFNEITCALLISAEFKSLPLLLNNTKNGIGSWHWIFIH